MAEEALRRLERAVDEDPTTEARLRFGRALRRAGRTDEALAALRPALAEPAVRREVGRLPTWTHFRGDAGQRRWIDVAPLRSKPRVRWSRGLDAPSPDTLLASPLAVVVGSERRTVILDPETGRERRRLGSGLPPLILEDLVLLPSRSMLVARELWTGESVWTAVQRAHPYTTTHAASRLVLGERQGLLAFDVEDTRRAPERRWLHRIRGGIWEGNPTHILAAGAHVVVSSEAARPSVRAVLDAETGAERWRVVGCDMTMLDPDGLLVRHFPGHAGPIETCLYDADGVARWSARRTNPVLLAPDYVVLEEVGERRPSPDPREEGATLCVFRESGDPRAVLPREQAYGGPVAAARDVIYFGGYGSITAVTADGASLWRLALPQARAGSFISSLAPLPGALCGHTSDGVVFCLDAEE